MCFYIICALLVLHVFSFKAYSQASGTDSLKIDSLKSVLVTEKEDTNKVNTLNELSAFLNHDRNSAMQYAKEAVSLSQKINFKNGEGNAYYQMGIAEAGSNYVGERGNINAAVAYFNNAIAIFRKLNNQTRIADSYESLANIYANLSQNYPETEKYMYNALRIYEKLGDKNKIASVSLALGLSYTYNGNDTTGFKILENSLNTYKEINDSENIAVTNIYIGKAYLNKSKYEDALHYFNNALSIYRALGKRSPDFGIPWTNGNIADVYIYQGEDAHYSGNNTLALEKQEAALKLLKERMQMEDAGNMSHRDTYIQLGDCYMDLSDLKKGKDKINTLLQSQKYYDSSLQLSKQTKNKNLLSNSYYKLSNVNNALGNYKEAYENYRAYIVYRDSIFNEETAKKTVQTQMQYDFDKKESIAKAAQDKKDAEAKRVKNQQYFAIAGLGIVVLAVLIIALIQFRNNKQKQKANLLLEKQKQKIETTLTELKSTQAQLIQSEKMASLGELTAGIAHEIQNPLNFVNNFSEVNKELVDEMQLEMDRGDYDDAKAISNDIKENEQKINHHGKRADAIVKNMLQHSRTSTGQKEPTDINALADEYLRLSYHGMRAKDKTFNTEMKSDFDKSIGKINIVPQDIGRVLLNLYNNAFYAVAEKMKQQPEGFEPIVSVITKRMSDKIEIRVKDNGNGIPQKAMDKIFQPFFTTKPTGEGTGLGLSLSYDIIKAHGGEIKVEIREPEGTTFVIQIPST